MLAWIPGQVFDQSEFDLDRAELADIDMKHVRGVWLGHRQDVGVSVGGVDAACQSVGVHRAHDQMVIGVDVGKHQVQLRIAQVSWDWDFQSGIVT